MKVQLEYLAPVQVVVDLQAGTVEKVWVCDDLVDRPGGAQAWHPDSRELDAIGGERVQRAERVADSAVWPVWEVGA